MRLVEKAIRLNPHYPAQYLVNLVPNARNT